MNQSSVEGKRHLPGLDTLRALAILLVIPRHAWEQLKWPWLRVFFGRYGWMGVDLFFVLSGFLIGSQLFQTLKKAGSISLRRFYLKRALRILPCYFAVLFLYMIWPQFRETPDMQSWWRFVTFTMNLGVERGKWAFSHAWSLCIEEHFYMLFPAIVFACMKFKKDWAPSLLVATFLIGGVALRYILWSTNAPFYPAVYRPTYTHLDGLLVGIIIALLREYRDRIWNRLVSQPWIFVFWGISSCSLGGWFLGNLGDKSPLTFLFTFPLVAFGFGCLVVAALSPNFWLAKAKIPGASTLATLAYTLYLTHKQMIHLATQFLGQDETQQWSIITLSLLLIIVAAGTLHFLIERPFLALRDRLLHR